MPVNTGNDASRSAVGDDTVSRARSLKEAIGSVLKWVPLRTLLELARGRADARLCESANPHQAVIARFRAPHLARPPRELPHVRAAAVAWKRGEALACGIELDDRIGVEIGEPHLVALIDVDRIGAGALAWQMPLTPSAAGRVEHAHLARVPFADPQSTLGVRPDAARSLARRRWLDHRRDTAVKIDPREIAVRKRYEVDIAARRGRDAIR